MKREEILINATPSEVRAALVDSGVLQEVQIERTSRVGLVSNIYKGKVSRVLPGMQAAFVELGLERTAFLHASDIARDRKSTRLNSSHSQISYAVFCLKKKRCFRCLCRIRK